MSETIKGGILVLDKPKGFTSQDAVNKIRRFYRTKSVGHTGTLDPMATGVLTVLVGRAVKASEYLMSQEKTYLVKASFGYTTDTQDTSGKVLWESGILPDEDSLLRAISHFTGDIMQIPPMYSALKRGGQKLVDLARKGIVLEREARKINIRDITLLDFDKKSATMSVTCSKGTYIRTLCEDIGAYLSCGATMSYLRRTKNGDFSLDDATTLDALSNMSYDELISRLIPVESAFLDFPIMHLEPFYERLAKNGAFIYLDRTGDKFSVGERVRLYGSDGFFALAEIHTGDEGNYARILKFL